MPLFLNMILCSPGTSLTLVIARLTFCRFYHHDGKTTEITSVDNEALTTIANGINNLKAFDYASYHLCRADLANTDLTNGYPHYVSGRAYCKR